MLRPAAGGWLGDLHGASHVFLARLRGGRAELLLQKRSAQKDSFPGLYDISAAGHLDPGEDFAAAARRELAEELGVTLVSHCRDGRLRVLSCPDRIAG